VGEGEGDCSFFLRVGRGTAPWRRSAGRERRLYFGILELVQTREREPELGSSGRLAGTWKSRSKRELTELVEIELVREKSRKEMTVNGCKTSTVSKVNGSSAKMINC